MIGRFAAGGIKIVLWVGLAALAAVITAGLIQQGRAEYLDRYSKNPDDAIVVRELDPELAQYAKSLGDYFFDKRVPSSPDLARFEYLDALRLNPHEAFHWSGWARVNARFGQIEKARRAFNVADTLDPMNWVIQQQYAQFLLQQNEIEEALKHHARVIRIRPSMARNFWVFYLRMGQRPLALAKEALGGDPVLVRHLFIDCLAMEQSADIEELWRAYREVEGFATADSYQAYFDYLMGSKRYTDAKALWHDIAEGFYQSGWSEQEALFWNGKFDHPIAFPGGLEWRIPKQPAGIRAVIRRSEVEAEGNSLWVHFEGSENARMANVSHILFVEPGKTYTLSYHVSALDLTTANGPYVLLTLMSEPRVQYRGRGVTETGSWTLEETFTAPGDCHVALVSICRDPSDRMDARIKGDAWYDDFTLTAADTGDSESLSR
jgi:hypothetical protein